MNYLKKRYFWATHCRLTAITEAANTVKKHWGGILNYFDSKIKNELTPKLKNCFFRYQL